MRDFMDPPFFLQYNHVLAVSVAMVGSESWPTP